MYDKISTAIDDGEFTLGIFIKLSKAFDTLNHEILLTKLGDYGIRGITLAWFKSYRYNRHQYVYFNGAASSFSYLTAGPSK